VTADSLKKMIGICELCEVRNDVYQLSLASDIKGLFLKLYHSSVPEFVSYDN